MDIMSDSKSSVFQLKNPHLKEMDKDHLFHLGLTTDDDLKGLFGDVKVNLKNVVSKLCHCHLCCADLSCT